MLGPGLIKVLEEDIAADGMRAKRKINTVQNDTWTLNFTKMVIDS